MSDDERMPEPASALPLLPPRSLVILRSRDTARLSMMAGQIIPDAHARGLKVLVAGSVRRAILLGADGAHLSEAQAARLAAADILPKRLPDDFIISAAAHSLKALHRAKCAGAHFALLGPVFPTESHPEKETMGVHRFARLVRQSPINVVALGGIGPENVGRISRCGALGAGGIKMFWPATKA